MEECQEVHWKSYRHQPIHIITSTCTRMVQNGMASNVNGNFAIRNLFKPSSVLCGEGVYTVKLDDLDQTVWYVLSWVAEINQQMHHSRMPQSRTTPQPSRAMFPSIVFHSVKAHLLKRKCRNIVLCWMYLYLCKYIHSCEYVCIYSFKLNESVHRLLL